MTAAARDAEWKLARHDVERRRLLASLDGVVVQLLKHPGEWLQAGEPVLRLVRMDRVRVEGFVDASLYGDDEVADQPVRVFVARQRGQRETFSGKIVFVNPLIEASGNYRVWAEVENRQRNGRWLLRPGSEAEMVIELASSAAADKAR
jgi:multidrug resistance efflux pump